MDTFYFKHWQAALAKEPLSENLKRAYQYILIGYLSYLRQQKTGASIGSARAYIRQKIAEKRPASWQAQRWKDALNWWFKNAPSKRRHRNPTDARFQASAHTKKKQYADGRQRYPVTIRQYQKKVSSEPLIEDMIKLMRIRHMAYRTEETYVGWVRRLARFHVDKRLDEFDEEGLKAFLNHLAVEEGVSAGTQRQALNACVFFLREVRKLKLGDFSDYVQANPNKYYPVVYSKNEIIALLNALTGTYHLMAKLQYGCGLRISELCRLRVKDIDFARNKVYIRAGKGNKDRIIGLPHSLKADLELHLLAQKKVHDGDRAAQRPGVYMPGCLDKKYPRAAKSWEWFWVFSSEVLSIDPRSPRLGKRRHHILPGVFQKHLTQAVSKAAIPKRSNSHILRHSYATHLLENGVNIRTVQDLLGHQCIETTMIYLHVMEDSSATSNSPLDTLAQKC